MTEQEIDRLLAAFQRACGMVVTEGDSHLSATTKERAIFRNQLRAELIECQKWQDDFKAAEKTAQQLDAHWQTLSDLTGVDEENDNPWPAVVGRVAQMRQGLIELAKLACETPQFFNPVEIWEAKQLRDAVLAANSIEVLK